MATRRTPINRGRRARMTPELKVNAERLQQLSADHLDAIQSGDDSFYHNGRHEELVRLKTEVYRPLGIRPWDDADERLREALEAAS